jgi:hypothetical protein
MRAISSVSKWDRGGHLPFRSGPFLSLAQRFPWFGLPLPTAYIGGLDYMLILNQQATTYLLGHSHRDRLWYYFPLALAFKLPLGTWGALVTRSVRAPREDVGSSRAGGLGHGWGLGRAAAHGAVLPRYNFGIRYLLPAAPAGLRVVRQACCRAKSLRAGASRGGGVRGPPGAGGLCSARPGSSRSTTGHRADRAGAIASSTTRNVDWGQGLVALREEIAKRGIRRIHLSYHGTTDPAVYGIDYVPYLSGPVAQRANGSP